MQVCARPPGQSLAHCPSGKGMSEEISLYIQTAETCSQAPACRGVLAGGSLAGTPEESPPGLPGSRCKRLHDHFTILQTQQGHAGIGLTLLVVEVYEGAGALFLDDSQAGALQPGHSDDWVVQIPFLCHRRRDGRLL